MGVFVKGQLISKANLLSREFLQKTNEWILFTTMQRVLVLFLEEIEDTKKNFSKLPDL